MIIKGYRVNDAEIDRLIRGAFKSAGINDPHKWDQIPMLGNIKRMRMVIRLAIRKGIEAMERKYEGISLNTPE